MENALSPTLDGLENLTVDSLITTDLATTTFSTDFLNAVPTSYFTGIRSNIQTQIDTFSTPATAITSTVLLQANSGVGKILYTSDGLIPSAGNTVSAKIYANTSKEVHHDFNNSLNFNSTNDFNSTISNVMRIEPNQIINKKNTRISGQNILEMGFGETKGIFSGFITYGGFDIYTYDSKTYLHIVGAGGDYNRNVLIWDNLRTGNIDTWNEITCGSNLNVAGQNALKLGYDVSGKDNDAGRIVYGYYDAYNEGENNLYIVGAGTDNINRQVYIYDKLKVKFDITAGRRIFTPALTLNGSDLATLIGLKQDLITSTTNLTCGNISSNNITIGSTGTTYNLTVNGTTLSASLASKQNTLNATTDLQVKGLNCYGDLVIGQTGWNNAIYLNGKKLVIKTNSDGGLYIVPLPVGGIIGGGFFGGGGGGGGGGGSGGDGGGDDDGDTSSYDYESRIRALEGKTQYQSASTATSKTNFASNLGITSTSGLYSAVQLNRDGTINTSGNITLQPYGDTPKLTLDAETGDVDSFGHVGSVSSSTTENAQVGGNLNVIGNYDLGTTLSGTQTLRGNFININGSVVNINAISINLNGIVNYPSMFFNAFIDQFAS